MVLGYRIVFSGSTSIHYSGVVTITAATAVTIHPSFGLKMKINKTSLRTASHRRAMSLCGKSHVGNKALPTRLALLYNGGWPTLLIGLAQNGSPA